MYCIFFKKSQEIGSADKRTNHTSLITKLNPQIWSTKPADGAMYL